MGELLQLTDITISPIQATDIPLLEPILREHIIDPATGQQVESEIQLVMKFMSGEPDSDHHDRRRSYLVARDITGEILGCVGITEAAQYHLNHHQTTPEDTAELVNFFVTTRAQGKGVGRKLFNSVIEEAKKRGKKFLVLDSGPRYKHTWEKYEKIFGYPGTMIENLYGPEIHAKTWKMTL